MGFSWRSGGSPSRSEILCPGFLLFCSGLLVVFGYINYRQGYFLRPDEAKGGCQGHIAHSGEMEKEWRTAWTGSCAFLYRNEQEHDSADERASWHISHGKEYDHCYRLACKEFCSKHTCLASKVATFLWVSAAVLGLMAVICSCCVCSKVAQEQLTEPKGSP
eukprot:TRINITY_DN6058_c0_g1_i1.p1 TRINITY_DN6058_c0_g1~~TRINITY_DN6058_c0_g1_i1.p1  ORF type:complete len:162 (-),score=19.70 TRINITY_DN6058_c0_g1_i1:263-748(-)